jgi:DNA-binding NarL/FixJ family response regulator
VKIHLAPSADTPRVIERIKSAYPTVEMVARRQTTRAPRSPAQIRGGLSDRLTDRQQAVLEAGYFAGFFELPRGRSGEDVAESLGISSSTFRHPSLIRITVRQVFVDPDVLDSALGRLDP